VIPLVRGERILDLGCGYGHWGHLLLSHYRAWRPAKIHVVGVDLFPGNVELCRNLGVYDEVVHADVLDYLSGLPGGGFDTIIATELIEHLEKPAGATFLDELDRVAKQTIILSTPNFPDLRGGATTMLGFNEWEHHVSQWTAKEFRARGYAICGVNHKIHKLRVRGSYRLFSVFPALESFARAWAERHPTIALDLLAAKHVDGEPVCFRYGVS